VVGRASILLARVAAVRAYEDAMIYLFEDMTAEQLKRANDGYLEHFICAATGHIPATRHGFNSTSCLCGAWHRQVTWPADDEVSMVTVEALREEVRICQRRIQDLRGALEDAIEYLQSSWFTREEQAFATRLNDVLIGKASS